MDPLGSLNILSIKQKRNILKDKEKKNTTWRQSEEGLYMDNVQLQSESQPRRIVLTKFMVG